MLFYINSLSLLLKNKQNQQTKHKQKNKHQPNKHKAPKPKLNPMSKAKNPTASNSVNF